MHEESEGRRLPNGQVENVIGTNRYGERGKHLAPMFDYEKDYYDSDDEAGHAAERRSRDFGNLLDASLQRHDETPKVMNGFKRAY